MQRWLCRDCGFRFTQSGIKCNVDGQVLEGLGSGENSHQHRVVSRASSVKEAFDGLSFFGSKYVCSHDQSCLTVAEKRLNSLPSIIEATSMR